MMTTQTLETVLKKAFAHADGNAVMLSFQGGEPLLRGKTFFRALDSMLGRLNIKKSPVHIGIQTNGTLIDDEWCGIFQSGNYLVGLSLDGDARANENRIDADGKPVFGRIIEAAHLLKQHGVQFNILSVLTKSVAERIDEIYAFFKAEGFSHLQFIPCLKPLDGAAENDGLSPDADAYAHFLKTAFSLYLKDMKNGDYTSVRQFDNFAVLANGKRAEQCGMNGHCTHQYVIEADGEVYPCDFYCTDEYSLGNILSTDFAALERSPKAIDFIKQSLTVEEKCKKCAYYRLCGNGCKRERRDIDKCGAYKAFFAYALPHLKRMS